jgi:hypothetical protein
MIRINLKLALDEGDKEAAAKLWDVLSDLAKPELLSKAEAKKENISNST